jgi:hypothetical protein
LQPIGMAVVALIAVAQGQEHKDRNGLGFEDLAKLVANDELPDGKRVAALEALGRLDDAPREKVQEIALGLLGNRAESTLMRGKSVVLLLGKPYANERTWDALEATLLHPEEKDGIVQRMCLNSLGSQAPLDRLVKLLARREVHRHAYFAFRIDVASAVSALNLREEFAFDILCEYLVDEDPADERFQVRQEAWLSLWTLTGKAYGVRGDFERRPKRFRNRESARPYLWRIEYLRPGVGREHLAALKRVTPDLEQMRAIREAYRKLRPMQLAIWARERAQELATARAQCKRYDDLAKAWRMITGKTPDSLQDLEAPLKPGDDAFMDPVADDPWGRPYVLRREGRKLRIHSCGEDGLEGTDDDVVYPDK